MSLLFFILGSVLYLTVYTFLNIWILWFDTTVTFYSVTAIVFPFILSAIILYITTKNKKKTSFQKVLLVLFLLVMAGVFADSSYRVLVNESCETFSHDKWIKYPDKRDLMVSDLTSRYLEKGMKQEEMTELLGSPDAIDGNRYMYTIDSHSFDPITFDIITKNGKVMDYRVQFH